MPKWQNASRALERILLFGVPGSGKTKAIMQVIERTVGEVWVIETDPTYDEFLDAYPDVGVVEEWHGQRRVDDYVSDSGIVHLYRVRNWEDIRWAIRQVKAQATRSDWIVLDNGTRAWDAVQHWYIEVTYGQELDEFLLAARQERVEKGDLKSKPEEAIFHDWTTINAQYNQVREFMLNTSSNLIVTAGQKVPDPRSLAQKATKGLYGGVGFMPEGQKMLGHDVRTVLWLTKDSRFGEEEYRLTTLKDRERPKMTDVDWTDQSFFDVYLRGVGKWKPTVLKDRNGGVTEA